MGKGSSDLTAIKKTRPRQASHQTRIKNERSVTKLGQGEGWQANIGQPDAAPKKIKTSLSRFLPAIGGMISTELQSKWTLRNKKKHSSTRVLLDVFEKFPALSLLAYKGQDVLEQHQSTQQ